MIVRAQHVGRRPNVGRRQFISALGGAAAAWPRPAGAQQADKLRLIGVLMAWPSDDPEGQYRFTGFRNALSEFGWTGGRNVRIEVHSRGANLEHLKDYAAELVALAPGVILCGPYPAAKELSRSNCRITATVATGQN